MTVETGTKLHGAKQLQGGSALLSLKTHDVCSKRCAATPHLHAKVGPHEQDHKYETSDVGK